MKKDAYYFPHFSNARNDRKIRRTIKELGLEGYAIYFMLLEVLREQRDFKYPLSDIDLLADEFGSQEPKVRVVICNYDLFIVDKTENFFSIRMIENLQPYLERSKRAQKAATIRWKNANAYANALPEHSASNASKGKETKRKEKKINKNATSVAGKPQYGRQDINQIVEKIKSVNNGMLDGSIRATRHNIKNLITKVEKTNLAGGETAKFICGIIDTANEGWYSGKICSGRYLYDNLGKMYNETQPKKSNFEILIDKYEKQNAAK